MSYQFKLEALRRYRLFQEEALNKELADAQRLRDLAIQDLAGIQAMRDKTEADLQQQKVRAGFAPQVIVFHRFLRKLAEDLIRQQHKVQAAQTLCDQRREDLLEAMKKRKALDKLKENGLRAYLSDLDKEEAKFINEMAINRFNLESLNKEND